MPTREENDRIGVARSPQRPNPRPGGSLPGDRRYTPRETERNGISFTWDWTPWDKTPTSKYKVGDKLQSYNTLAVITEIRSAKTGFPEGSYVLQPYDKAGNIKGVVIELSIPYVDAGSAWWLATPAQEPLIPDVPEPAIGTLNVYVIRGDTSPLPEYGKVAPGEKIIFEAEFGGAAYWWSSGTNFILEDSSGQELLRIWGKINVFASKASARPTAPLQEGSYTLRAESLPYARSSYFHFTVSKDAEPPPEESSGLDKLFEIAGGSIKMIAIGGIVIIGGYYLVKSGVLWKTASKKNGEK